MKITCNAVFCLVTTCNVGLTNLASWRPPSSGVHVCQTSLPILHFSPYSNPSPNRSLAFSLYPGYLFSVSLETCCPSIFDSTPRDTARLAVLCFQIPAAETPRFPPQTALLRTQNTVQPASIIKCLGVLQLLKQGYTL